MAFERHTQRYYAARPSWNRGSTINGKPAWLVAEERRQQILNKEKKDAD